jgi:hypothetical protein
MDSRTTPLIKNSFPTKYPQGPKVAGWSTWVQIVYTVMNTILLTTAAVILLMLIDVPMATPYTQWSFILETSCLVLMMPFAIAVYYSRGSSVWMMGGTALVALAAFGCTVATAINLVVVGVANETDMVSVTPNLFWCIFSFVCAKAVLTLAFCITNIVMIIYAFVAAKVATM